MRDEGVTKYDCVFRKTKAPAETSIGELNEVRNRLFSLGLIGVYPDGIGYGNISRRIQTVNEFIISGTQTGREPHLTAADYSLVTGYDILKNRVFCEGLITASSESMTHAAVYELDAVINAVIHVHHRQLWLRGRDRYPTTEKNIPYGTPAMAAEMSRLYRASALPEEKILLMLGHDEGVITFGVNLQEAFLVLEKALEYLAR
jgi:L-ribulose-5-phosphate 4-epimerase